MLFLSRLHFSLTPAWQPDRKYFIWVAPLLLCLSIQRQQVCFVKGEGWGRERRLKVEIRWAWLFCFGDIFLLLFLFALRGWRAKGEGSLRQTPSLAFSSLSATGACEPREKMKWEKHFWLTADLTGDWYTKITLMSEEGLTSCWMPVCVRAT